MNVDPSLWGSYAGTFADWEEEGVTEPYYKTPDGKVALLDELRRLRMNVIQLAATKPQSLAPGGLFGCPDPAPRRNGVSPSADDVHNLRLLEGRVLVGTQYEQQSGLFSLDSKVGEQRQSDSRSDTISGIPSMKPLAVAGRRFVPLHMTAKPSLEHFDRDRADLLDPNAFLVHRLAGITPDSHVVGSPAHREEAVRIKNASEIGQLDIIHVFSIPLSGMLCN